VPFGDDAAVLSASKQAIAQAALEPGPHAVVSADREGIIRDWNETAEQEERADHWRNFRRVMATGVLNYRPDHVLDIDGLRRDGTRVMLDAALIATP